MIRKRAGEPKAATSGAQSAGPGLSAGARIWAAVIGAALLVLAAAPAALASDSVYWTNLAGAIRVGNLNGGSAANLFTGESDPYGVAIDPAAGKIYWANDAGAASTIRVANLNGSGPATTLYTGENDPIGVAIDPAAGKIYWASASGAIRVANLNGTGSATTLFPASLPQGVAIDPAAGKIYWADYGTKAIRVGNLNGSGSATTLFPGENNPTGVAIDAAAGKIYWTSSDGIRVGYLNGSASAATLFPGESTFSVAIDPAAGKIYWPDYISSAIRVGNLNGSGPAADLVTGENDPHFLALLRAPAGTATPQVAGGSAVGSTLSCSQGSWAADLLGSFLYTAPASFAYQWTFNGADIAGATSSSYTAPAGGSYACRVTATNQAGASSQTSAVFTVTGGGTPPPTLTNVGQSHRRWREGSALPHIASMRPPVGTTFRFAVTEPATVRFAFTQRLPGRRVGRRCVAQTRKNRLKPKCTRTVTAGALRFSVGAGAHKVRFQGRISKHKRLKPGRYTLIITATDSAGQPVTAKLTFTIVAG